MFNYGAFQGPQILLDRDIVYVNLNYRLGTLGKKELFINSNIEISVPQGPVLGLQINTKAAGELICAF